MSEIDHVLPYQPRWWRIDLQSQVEISFDDPDDLEPFSSTARLVLRSHPPIIRLRPYRYVFWEGERTREYGAWLTFMLAEDEHGHYARTTMVDCVFRFDVYALEPPTLGQWTACVPELEDAA